MPSLMTAGENGPAALPRSSAPTAGSRCPRSQLHRSVNACQTGPAHPHVAVDEADRQDPVAPDGRSLGDFVRWGCLPRVDEPSGDARVDAPAGGIFANADRQREGPHLELTSSSLIWRFSSAMMPTAARVVAANAAVTVAGAASCWVPRAARISRARAAILRCRPPCLSAAWIAVRLRWAPCSGLGARPSTPSASPWESSSKATAGNEHSAGFQPPRRQASC